MDTLTSGQQNKSPASSVNSSPSSGPTKITTSEQSSGSNTVIWVIVIVVVLVIIIAIVALVLYFVLSGDDSCTSDSNCGDGEICVSGTCQEGCRSDSDCTAGLICNQNKCITKPTTCNSNSDCTSDQKCIRNSLGGICVTKCTSDSNCPSSTFCNTDLGFCVPNCSNNDCLCAPDHVCNKNACVSATPFTASKGIVYLVRKCTSNLPVATDLSDANINTNDFVSRTYTASADGEYTYSGVNTPVAWELGFTGTNPLGTPYPNVGIYYVNIENSQFSRGTNVIATGNTSGTYKYCDNDSRNPMMSNSLYVILRYNNSGEYDEENPIAVYIASARDTSLKISVNLSNDSASFTSGPYTDVCSS